MTQAYKHEFSIMNLIKIIFIIFLILWNHNTILATDQAIKVSKPDNSDAHAPAESVKTSANFQKIIDEFKSYAKSVPKKVQDEIIEYRIKIANLNKQKRLLYKKLSQDAQDYLQQLQAYKTKLPLQHENIINEPDEDHID